MRKIVASILILVISVVQYTTVSATTYYTWPKGGCYTYSASGKKVYVSHHLCNRDDEGTNWIYNSKTKKTYYTGPEWGCFYYGTNWKKNYVSHSYCGR